MKKYIIPIVLILTSFIGWLSFNAIGSEVATDGTLIEPFFLIPLSWLFLFMGITWGIFIFIKGKPTH
ncbi:DUF3955 domain-containing protein [Candidatus Wolfebacteria bacterium]|nr:DUF3955 domain-containing protein [Candidatus Wolfebacteria bacterium]